MLATYNVVIYHCSGVVLGKQVESKFTEVTKGLIFYFLTVNYQIHPFDLSVQMRCYFS